MDIEGVGGIVAGKLVESGLVTEPLDLFHCAVSELASLNLGSRDAPRVFGEKNASKLLDALEKSRSTDLARWIHALGIPHVGKTMAFRLGKSHTTLEELAASPILEKIRRLEEIKQLSKQCNPNSRLNPLPSSLQRKEKEALSLRLRKGTKGRRSPSPGEQESWERDFHKLQEEIRTLREQEEIEKQERKKQFETCTDKISRGETEIRQAGLGGEIGPVVAGSVLEFFASRSGKEILSRMRKLGIAPRGGLPPSPSTPAYSLAGQTFVLTGTLSGLSRDRAAEEIRNRGGKVTGSVTRNTSFVVVGRDPGENKREKARTLGIPEIGEETLLQRLGLKKGKPESPEQEDLFSP